MKLSPHFNLEEFTRSSTAARLGIDNDLPIELTGEAQRTAAMMEAIRAYLSKVKGYPVTVRVSSGYRCLPLNKAIGSKDTSDHVLMCAIDFTAPGFGSPFEVAKELAPVVDSLGIGQLILEYGQWIHVSTKTPKNINNRIITISHSGTVMGIVKD